MPPSDIFFSLFFFLGSENDASLSVNSFYAATENDAFSANLSYLGSSQGEGKKKKKKKRTKKKGLEPLPVDWSCGNWNARFQDIMDQVRRARVKNIKKME